MFLTGAGKGIGREIACEVAKSGMDLVLVGRTKESLEETAHICAKFNKNNFIVVADLSKPEEIEVAVESAIREFRTISAFVNNHGVHHRDLIVDVDKNDYRMEEMIDVNLRSCITLTRLLLPHIIASRPHNPLHRALIFISSLAARTPVVMSAAYAASKSGMSCFAHVLFDEIKERGIKVSSILPGFVDTNQTHRDKLMHLDHKKMISPVDIAKTVRFIMDFPSNACPTEIQIRPQYSPYLA